MPYDRMRGFNKHFLNHLTRFFARLPRGPFAVITHVGRRSGKLYETPIMVEKDGNRFVIALTYGADVDWYRNIQAAGHARLVWHGQNYNLEKPEPLSINQALLLYSPIERLILRRRGTKDFVRIRYRQGTNGSKAARGQ